MQSYRMGMCFSLAGMGHYVNVPTASAGKFCFVCNKSYRRNVNSQDRIIDG